MTCELCGDEIIGGHYSVEWHAYEGVGSMLHESCAEGLSNMPKARAVRVLGITRTYHGRNFLSSCLKGESRG